MIIFTGSKFKFLVFAGFTGTDNSEVFLDQPMHNNAKAMKRIRMSFQTLRTTGLP